MYHKSDQHQYTVNPFHKKRLCNFAESKIEKYKDI